MKLIKNLQQKPRYIRIQILWISVILTMIIIFSFWMIHLKSGLNSSRGETESEKESVPSLFSSLKNDFLFLKNKLKAGVGQTVKESESKSKFEVEIIK